MNTSQSLASGAAGTALLAVEQAAADLAPWPAATAAVRALTADALDIGPAAALFYGAPAVAVVLHAAASADPRYAAAADRLDGHLSTLTHRRLDHADARAASGVAAAFGEYDLFYGLAGLTGLLLARAPAADVTGRALTHLVALTQLRRDGGTWRPGWWVEHDPDPLYPTPGGHANLGMAHGAAGILALLALAVRAGAEVPGQQAAIAGVADFLSTWRQDGRTGPWWPQWLTEDELRTGRHRQPAAGRASWCYGAVGITRALQLAALAVGDIGAQRQAEADLVANLSPSHLAGLTESGLCHGLAGVYQTVVRAAADARTPEPAAHLPAIEQALTGHRFADHPGLLTGSTGDDLARHTARTGAPASGWDRCLLIV